MITSVLKEKFKGEKLLHVTWLTVLGSCGGWPLLAQNVHSLLWRLFFTIILINLLKIEGVFWQSWLHEEEAKLELENFCSNNREGKFGAIGCTPTRNSKVERRKKDGYVTLEDCNYNQSIFVIIVFLCSIELLAVMAKKRRNLRQLILLHQF